MAKNLCPYPKAVSVISAVFLLVLAGSVSVVATVFLIVCELRIDIPLPDYTTALFTTSYNQRNLVPDIFYAILNGTDKSRWSENGHIGKMLSMLSRKCNVAM